MDEKFKNTVEKFQDILDYYVQNEIFSKKCGSKWNIYNKFFINTSILKNVLIQIIHMKFGNNLLEVKYNFYL